MNIDDFGLRLKKLLDNATVERISQKEIPSGWSARGYSIRSSVPQSAPMEVFISASEVLVVVGNAMGTELGLFDQDDSEGLLAALDFIQDIAVEGCTATVWYRSGEVVASSLSVGGRRSSRMNISGIIKLGTKKEVTHYKPFQDRIVPSKPSLTLTSEGDEIDIKELQKKVLDFLDGHNANYKIGTEQEHKDITVRTTEALLKISLSNSWIGYELTIDKEVLGKKFGTFLDTDIYPIGGKYKEISLKIFDETMECLVGLLSGDVWVGKIDKKLVLATPISKEKYSLCKMGRFLSSKQEIDKDQLKQLGPLRPVK
jgi:hypothetical protein